MNPQYAAIERLVRRRSPVWQKRLRLEHFGIRHAFIDSYFGDDGEEDFKITASTETRWNYFQAKVKWYLPSAARHELSDIEGTLVHELVHVLLAPEQYLLDKQVARDTDGLDEADAALVTALYYERMEMATEQVTQTLLRAYPL